MESRTVTLAPANSGNRKVGTWVQVLATFLGGLLFYMSLYGDLPYHDVARFVGQVESGQFVWDIGHIFLQPVTLLWHEYLGFGETAEMSQKHINSVATAASLAVFYLLLLRLQIPLGRRIAATLLIATTASIMTLAPSGHMKLLASPFLDGAILCSVLWEREISAGDRRNDNLLWGAAVLLATASALLASCLAAAPFVGLAILLASRRDGSGWAVSLRRAVSFGALCGVTFLLFASFGYVVFAGEPLTLEGLAHSVGVKENLRPGFVSIIDSIGRQIYGVPGNFIAAPALGPVLRAWLGGFIPSLVPYAGTLLIELVPWFATLLLIAIIYLRSFIRIIAGAQGLMLLAYLSGATIWSAYYNLDDPEHWFALTVPTVLLFLTQFPPGITRVAVPVWAVLTTSINLAYIGIPVSSFPLRAGALELNVAYTPKDLLVDFAAYPGGAYLGSFTLDGLRQLKLDQEFRASRSTDEFFDHVDAAFRSTWNNGGRVVVFDLLDPYNWNAPWFTLSRSGLTKGKLNAFLTSRYTIISLPQIARLNVWEIRPQVPKR